MSSSTTNDITKWSNDQLHEHEDNKDELYKRKSTEHMHRMKAWKEAEHQRVEEEMRRKAEEEAKQKVEVKAQRRVEAEVKAHAEEVAWAQSSVSGPSKGKQPKAAASGGHRAGGGPSPMLWVLRCWGSMQDETARGSKARLCNHCHQLKHRCKWLGDMQLTQQRKWEEVMSPQARKKKVWMQSPVADKDKDGDKEYEEEVVEVAEKREALKGQSKEEAEVDEIM
ncbi:hypothetical protein PAXRUDRAFT_9169 [Paxillus rubicundulus Ve08.2h10]|uniref:Uncharacterized protein n=1 Tax=Paxillus rubicundulus Ve08.2h10 TaxID=930991 RepID=A0A0D0DVQ1_9AGAM|nr:hypothetical protein PAXRUDRAFT_9169 [Paxillus rubicundulus Ve08.2h10]